MQIYKYGPKFRRGFMPTQSHVRLVGRYFGIGRGLKLIIHFFLLLKVRLSGAAIRSFDRGHPVVLSQY